MSYVLLRKTVYILLDSENSLKRLIGTAVWFNLIAKNAMLSTIRRMITQFELENSQEYKLYDRKSHVLI